MSIYRFVSLPLATNDPTVYKMISPYTVWSLFLCRRLHFFLRKINENSCHQSCSFWLQYAQNSLSAWVSFQTLQGELTAPGP